MLSYALSFFSSSAKPIDEKPLLEVPPSDVPVGPPSTLESLKQKLSAISKDSKNYLKEQTCKIIKIDAVLGVLSGAASAGLGYVFYNIQPSKQTLDCLNLLNTTLTESCKNGTQIFDQCEVNNLDCQDSTIRGVATSLTLLYILAGAICLTHAMLREYAKEKCERREQHRLDTELANEEQALLSELGIKGSASEKLQKIVSHIASNSSNLSEVVIENKSGRKSRSP